MGVILTIVALTALFGIACHIVAQRKGRNRATWLILGMFFGPFALAALLVLGTANK